MSPLMLRHFVQDEWAVPDGSSELRVSSLALLRVADGNGKLGPISFAVWCVPDGRSE